MRLRSIKVWSMMHFIGACHLQTEDCRLRLALSRAVVNLPSPVMLPKKRIDTYNGEINLSNIIPRQNCLEVLRTGIASCVYFKRIFNPLTPRDFCWKCIFFETGNSSCGAAKCSWRKFCSKFFTQISEHFRAYWRLNWASHLLNFSIDDVNFGQRW